jgi:Family of unknown function (DUF6049)
VDRERGSLRPGGSNPRGDTPHGDSPAPTIGVELARARRSSACVLGAVVVCALVLSAGGAGATAGAAGTSRAHGGAGGSTSPLTLLSQSPWVTPGEPFDVHLRIGTAAGPTSTLGVSVAVYPCLTSVSAFDQSLASSGPTGAPVSQTSSPLPVTSLHPLLGAGFDLSMPVGVGRGVAPAPGSPVPFTIQLTAASGQCQSYPSGVYPVRIELVRGGNQIGAMTTHLVYTQAAASTQRLRVAVVLPLQVTQRPAARPTTAELVARPDAALAPPSSAELSGVSGVVSALTSDPGVPVTLAASGQTVGVLADTAHVATLDQLGALAAADTHQFLAAPFTPVDATNLAAAGLDSELSAQITRGSEALASGVPHSPGVSLPTAAGPGAGLGAWVTNDDLDTPTLATLAADGYSQVVLPGDSVTSPPANGSTAETFALGSGKASVTAIASDADLAGRFTDDAGDPVLAATQLASELAQLYYERPNGLTPRGVAVVAPTGWNADPTFVTTLLAALQNNPMVEPVTVSSLFALFPSTTSCHGGCRLTGSGSTGGLPVTAIRTERQRIAAFATAAVGAKPLVVGLGDLVLAGESELLRATQQSAVLGNTAAALDAQLGQLVVAGDRTVTLTSQQGTLDVTIVSNASYPVTATLTLNSDKLLFPNGTTQWSQPDTLLLPSPHTNIVPVKVTTRASGTFRVAIALHSPNGALLLSSGSVDVRSTATSVVGIALTAGAFVVLAVWWIRTSRKRRARRREEERADDALDEHQPAAVR